MLEKFQFYSIIYLIILFSSVTVGLENVDQIIEEKNLHQDLMKCFLINKNLQEVFTSNEVRLIWMLGVLNGAQQVRQSMLIKLMRNVQSLIINYYHPSDITALIFEIDKQLLRQHVTLMIFIEIMNSFMTTRLDNTLMLSNKIDEYFANNRNNQLNLKKIPSMQMKLNALNKAIQVEVQFVKNIFDPKLTAALQHLLKQEEWNFLFRKLTKESNNIFVNPRQKRIVPSPPIEEVGVCFVNLIKSIEKNCKRLH